MYPGHRQCSVFHSFFSVFHTFFSEVKVDKLLCLKHSRVFAFGELVHGLNDIVVPLSLDLLGTTACWMRLHYFTNIAPARIHVHLGMSNQCISLERPQRL